MHEARFNTTGLKSVAGVNSSVQSQGGEAPRLSLKQHHGIHATSSTFDKPDLTEMRRHPRLIPGNGGHVTTLNKPDINEKHMAVLGIRQLAGYQ
jgi:hypothetical protein